MMLDVTTVDNNIFGQIDLIEFNFEYDSDKDKSGGAGKAKFSNLNIPPGNKEDYKFTICSKSRLKLFTFEVLSEQYKLSDSPIKLKDLKKDTEYIIILSN